MSNNQLKKDMSYSMSRGVDGKLRQQLLHAAINAGCDSVDLSDGEVLKASGSVDPISLLKKLYALHDGTVLLSSQARKNSTGGSSSTKNDEKKKLKFEFKVEMKNKGDIQRALHRMAGILGVTYLAANDKDGILTMIASTDSRTLYKALKNYRYLDVLSVAPSSGKSKSAGAAAGDEGGDKSKKKKDNTEKEKEAEEGTKKKGKEIGESSGTGGEPKHKGHTNKNNGGDDMEGRQTLPNPSYVGHLPPAYGAQPPPYHEPYYPYHPSIEEDPNACSIM